MTAVEENSFFFRGYKLNYFHHKYNNTWANERAVEIPIIMHILNQFLGKRILEVGNVLSHYYPVGHTVLDKYELAPGVINQDVVDYTPAEKYDLIVSISTIEHVGWDEEPKDPEKSLAALANLKNCLAQEGIIVVTLPLGQNPHLDRIMQEGRMPFTEQYFMKRISQDNKWVEAEWAEVRDTAYNYPFPFANAIVIGCVEQS